MLDLQTFNVIIENAPLVSIDLCLVCNGKILLGNRCNEPLKGQWFTPGGRIFKNESWQTALKRIALTELGLPSVKWAHFELMGIWDHFYPNSICNEKRTTHYVNLPHFIELASIPKIRLDNQHSELRWFDLDTVAKGEGFHEYIKNYAVYLASKDGGYVRD